MRNRNLPSYVIAIILAVIFIYPLYILILIAFEPISLTFDRLYPYQLPFVFTPKNLESSIKNLSLIKPVIRSVIVAFTVGILALVLATPAGYGLNKLSARFSNKIIMLLFVVNMMPAIVIAIPISVYFIKVGLYDNIFGIAWFSRSCGSARKPPSMMNTDMGKTTSSWARAMPNILS